MSAAGATRAIAPVGFAGALALVVGNMLGTGVYLLPATLAPYGAAALWGWAATLTGALALAAVFARLALRDPRGGGIYAHARRAFGDRVGAALGWVYWLSIASANAAFAVGFAAALGEAVPALATPAASTTLAVAALLAATASNLAGIAVANAAQIALTVLKLLPLALVAALCLPQADPSGWIAQGERAGGASVGLAAATAALVLWSMLGLESAAVPAERVRDPARTVPRATLMGTALTGIVTLTLASLVSIVLAARGDAPGGAPFAQAVAGVLGDAAGRFVALAMALAAYGTLHGWMLLASELPRALVKDGLLPAHFARLDRRGVARGPLLAAFALGAALIVANSGLGAIALFSFITLVSTACTLMPYFGVALAALVLDRRDAVASPERDVVSLLALVFAAFAASGVGAVPWLVAGALALAPLLLPARWRARTA